MGRAKGNMRSGAKIGMNSHQKRRRREVLIERFGMHCWLCNGQIDHPAQLSIDHVTPLSRGGRSNIENLRLAHRACNSARSDGPPPVLLLTAEMALS